MKIVSIKVLSAGLTHEKCSVMVAVNMMAFSFLIIGCVSLSKSDKSAKATVSSFVKAGQASLVTRLL